MKTPISEKKAAVAVIDAIFSQVKNSWPHIYSPLTGLCREWQMIAPDSEMAKFHFTLAALSVNIRTAFNVFPREQGEELFKITLAILKHHFKDDRGWQAIQNTILKYIDAYNNGLKQIRNPLQDVCIVLYHQVGMDIRDVEIHGKTYQTAPPDMINFLSEVMMDFTGKWEYLDKLHDVVSEENQPGDPNSSPDSN